ncbi:MAG: glycosyltransferase family 2 protein [Actinomycetota bacterium]|nr:glycosyltransferase family 2 protein [Nitrospiraceae bacterium]MDA8155957.1 glycosyltransferase family 2 protein [Actinomycetota bacterium]
MQIKARDISIIKATAIYSPGKKLPISVAIITKNEERNLPACLESVWCADEVIVVDSGSTDKTLEIAKQYGCRVFEEEWKGYGLQKQSAVDKCLNEWILIIDADETIPEETWKEIERVLTQDDGSFDAYFFPRKNLYMGKWLKHGYKWPDPVTRLFKKGKGKLCGSIVHECVVASKVKGLNVPIVHALNDSSLDKYLSKLNTYSSLLAKIAHENGKKGTALKAATSFLAHFFKIYILKKGVLDGREGFIVNFTEALNTFFKYLKLIELEENNYR